MIGTVFYTPAGGEQEQSLMKLLVVDDNRGDRRLVEIELEMAVPGAFQVTPADSLASALALVGQLPFDAAVLDMGLPDSRGVETVHRFVEAAPDLPVVVLTGLDDQSTGLAAVAAGAQDYLVKGNVHGDALNRALRHAIQRKSIEGQLRSSEAQQRHILESSPVGVVIASPRGDLMFANRRIEQLLGTTLVESRNRLAGDFYVNPQDRVELVAAVERGETLESRELALRRSDGSVMWSLVSMSGTVWNHQPAVLTWIYDISTRKADEVALRESKERAEALARARSEFLAVMSHEIRTPMNGILGMVRLMLDTALSEQQRDWAETISYSGEALVAILDDILDLSKLEAGRMELEEQDFDLRRTIDGVLSLLSSRGKEKGLHMSSRADKALPKQMKGDSRRIQQVLLNLVSNAVKFTDQGEVLVSVDDAGWGSDGRTRVRFTVTDSGPGITPETRDKLFHNFVQASVETSRLHGGSGLGLSICRRLVTLMGGEIGVDSVPGQGSAFWFVVPLDMASGRFPAIPRPAVASSAASLPSSPAPAAEAPAGGGGAAVAALPTAGESSRGPVVDDPALANLSLRILLAEDNVVNQKVAQGFLTRRGHSVTIARDGQEAVDLLKARAGDFDVVLMDMQMPRLDGLGATAAIRALPAPAALLPVVALTANVMQEDADACLQAGMDAYLAKPLRPQELYDTLVKMATLGRQRLATTRLAGEMPAVAGVTEAGVTEAQVVSSGDEGSPVGIPPRDRRITDLYPDVFDPKPLERLRLDLGDDYLVDLLRDYVQQAREQVSCILSATEHDPGTVRRAAHDLKATSRNFGLVAVANQAERVEMACKVEQMQHVAGLSVHFRQTLALGLGALHSYFPAIGPLPVEKE